VGIAEDVLYHIGKNPKRFVFKGRQLRIDRCKKSRQQLKATVVDQSVNDDTSNIVNIDIANVHYGTFIMGAAMNNITGVNSADGFGLIAHRLVNNEYNIRMRLRIDQQDKKISIIVSYQSLRMDGSSIDLAFEWNFGA
jgi:hypothetical protein